jgi:hypothetical protein
LSGLILGYFYLIGYIVLFMMCTVVAIFLSFTSCDSLEKMFSLSEKDHDEFQEACGLLKPSECYLSEPPEAEKSF